MPVEGVYTFTDVEGGTRLEFTLTMSPRWPMKAFGPVMGWMITRNLRRFYVTFKVLLEA